MNASEILERHLNLSLEKAPHEKDRNVIRRKNVHSYHVLKCGQELLKKTGNENLSKEDVKLCEDALLLHDIGRFYQVRDGLFDAKLDHGAIGGLALKDEGLADIPELYYPVVLHNKPDAVEILRKDEKYKNLPRERQEKILFILNVVQDADMVSNLLAAAAHNLPEVHFDRLTDPSFTPAVIEKLENNRPILIKDIKTRGDCWIFVFAWKALLNFEESKRMLREKEAYGKLLEYLKEDMAKRKARKKDLDVLPHIAGIMEKAGLL